MKELKEVLMEIEDQVRKAYSSEDLLEIKRQIRNIKEYLDHSEFLLDDLIENQN